MTGKAEAEAAAWFARLGDGACAPDAHAGLSQWRAERPANAAALAEMDALWSDLGEVATLSFYDDGKKATSGSQAANDEPGNSASSGARSRLWWPAGVAAAVAALIFIFVGLNPFDNPLTFETPVGGRQIASLPDHSRVILNTNSKVAARYTDDKRLITLNRGEALFEVSKDPRRPFVVRTHLGTVTALGTKFVVRDRGNAMEVTLLSGKVVVDPEREGRASFIMTPGQRVRIGTTGSTAVDKPSLSAVTAWRDGRLVLQDASAVGAIGEMNRYGQKTIALGPSANVAKCRVSGVFRVADTVRFAHILARICGLRLERHDDRYLITP